MKIKKPAFAAIIFNFLMLLVVAAISTTERTAWVTVSFYLYLFTFIVNVMLIKKTKHGFVNFPMVIYALIYLFHLSQIYFGYIGFDDFYCIFSRIRFESCQKAFTFAFICIHVMMLCFFVSYREFENKSLELADENITTKEKSIVTYVFWFMYLAKCIVRLYLFYMSAINGYRSLINAMSSIPSTIIMVADIFSVIYLRYCCKGKKRRNILLAIILLEIVFMASGSRILGITYLILLLLFVPIFPGGIKKLSAGKKIAIFCGALFLILLLPTISANRLYSTSIFSLDYLKESSILNSLIKEFGMTILNTTVAIRNRDSIELLNGLSYYGGVVTLVPNVGGFFNGLLEKIFYDNTLSNFFSYSYGGSNIGEAYMNFGSYGWLFFIPVGLLMGKLDRLLDMLLRKDLIAQIFIVALLYECILWIRSYFFLIIRLPIWLAIAWILVTALSGGKIKIMRRSQ